MAYNRLSDKRTKQATKNIDTPILGKYMATDTSHECKITGVEVRAVGNGDTVNSFRLLLENTFGETHSQNVFIWDTGTNEISKLLKSLVSTTMTHPTEVQKILKDLEDEDWTVLDNLMGKRVVAELTRTKGYRISNTVQGLTATDSEGTPIQSYESLAELKKDMESKGIRRSISYAAKFNRVGRKHATVTKETCQKSTTGASSSKPVGKSRAGQIPAKRKMW